MDLGLVWFLIFNLKIFNAESDSFLLVSVYTTKDNVTISFNSSARCNSAGSWKFLLYAFLDLHVSASFIATAVTGKLYQFEVVCEVNMKQLDYGKTHSRFHWCLILMFLRVQEHDIPRAEVVTFNFLFLHVLFENEKKYFLPVWSKLPPDLEGTYFCERERK